ncbi:13351_t:CDS:1, partial [Dentiscutata erythropus]
TKIRGFRYYICDKRSKSLVKFLYKNKTITLLGLHIKLFASTTRLNAVKDLVDALQINKTLKDLKIQHYNCGSNIETA